MSLLRLFCIAVGFVGDLFCLMAAQAIMFQGKLNVLSYWWLFALAAGFTTMLMWGLDL